MPTIALFGGSFNPPGVYHVQIAQELRRHFDLVLVVPCGPRPDKPSLTHIDPLHRATMVDTAFCRMKGVEVDLFDLERPTFSRAGELEDRYRDRGEVWHVIPYEFVRGASKGQSIIQKQWREGGALLERLRFAIIARPDDELDEEDLPEHHRLFLMDLADETLSFRERLFRAEPVEGMVPPEILAYIQRYGLYRGSVPSRATRGSLGEPRLLIMADERNPRAVAFAREFRNFEQPDNPNCIMVIGGDGSMLHAIQQHWRRRLPFFGVNAGHLGFLLNDPAEVLEHPFPPPELTMRQMPLLHVEVQRPDGAWHTGLSFNDAWVERATGQSAWLEVTIGGQTRIPKLVCDGMLVATAAGSTAYARSMGATPLLADTPAWIVVGSNVGQPPLWKSALLSLDSTVEVRNLHREKRPVNAYLHGVSQGEVVAMRARISRVACVELAFLPQHDMAEKIARIQFPEA